MDGSQKGKVCVSSTVGLVLGVLILTGVIVAVDTAPPIITIHSPQNTTYFTSNILLNVSADEPISTWWYNLNSGANLTFTPNITLTGLPTGQHNITVWANDSAGNVGLNSLPLGIAPDEEWNNTFGGVGREEAFSVYQTSDNGYIIAGYTESFGAGGADIFIVKTDSSGNHQWNKTFGGTGGDFAYSVQETSDGGYIIAGSTASYGAGKNDFWLVKTDSSGNHQWNKTFGGANNDGARSVQQTSDGGYIIAGYSDSGSELNVRLIKTDSSGIVVWDKTYSEVYGQAAYSVEQTSDGGYIVAGYTYNTISGNGQDVWIIKTYPNGTRTWDKKIGGTNDEFAISIQQTTDGGYIFSGPTNSFGAGDWDFWLVKTGSSGSPLWNKTFGGPLDDTARVVQQTSDGGYIVTGYTDSFGSGNSDIWLIKTNSTGGHLWNKTFGGSNFDQGWPVQQTNDRGYIVAGKVGSFGAGDYDFWLVKVKSETGPIYFSVIDTTPPTITFVSPTPANGTTLNQNYIYTNITADETLSTSLLEWNGTNDTMTPGSWYKNTTGLADGTYTYRVFGNDSSGNWNVSETRSVTIDTTSPLTTDNAPSGWQTKPFTVNLSCFDATSGCAATSYRVDGGSWTVGNSITISSDGNHTIEYNSTDVAGNKESTKTTYAALDTTTPSTDDDDDTPRHRTEVVLVANSIDYNLATEFLDYLEEKKIKVIRINPPELTESIKVENRLILTLGGPDAPEGVGEIVSELLSEDESSAMRESGAHKMYVKYNVWTDRYTYKQKIIIIAGSDREQTKLAHTENQNQVVSEIYD